MSEQRAHRSILLSVGSGAIGLLALALLAGFGRGVATGNTTQSATCITVDARPVPCDVVYGALAEAAGAQVLGEIAIDERLAQRIAAERITIGPADLDRERTELTRSMTDAADGDTAVRVLEQLRRERGLGEQRFAALLRRTAMLRALVRGGIVIDEPMLAATHRAIYGPKTIVRLCALPTRNAAAAFAAEIAATDASARELAFSTRTLASSTDASAAQGGLLRPFSDAEPSLPMAVRDAAGKLKSGEVSGPIALDRGYAVIMLLRTEPGDGSTLAERREVTERAARQRQERLAMDRLALALSGQDGVVLNDPVLRRAIGGR